VKLESEIRRPRFTPHEGAQSAGGFQQVFTSPTWGATAPGVGDGAAFDVPNGVEEA